MRYLKIVLPALLLAGFGLLVYFIPSFIKINAISCSSQFGPCSGELSNKLDSLKGKSLREVKSQLSGFLRSDPFIKEYSIQFRLPDKFEVNIIEGKAAFALGDNERKFYSLVDKEGKVIKVQEGTNLPVVYIAEKIPNLGEKVSYEKLFALETVYSLFSLYQVKEGKIENDSLVATLPDGITVVFPLDGDRQVLLGSLELILFRLKSEAKDTRIENITKIDLRFKNPVLQ